MRLPSPYVGLLPNLGEVLRRERKKLRIKQEVLAADLGIHRQALIRIEQGKQIPRLRTLYALLALLKIEFDCIALEGDGRASKNHLIFHEGHRGQQLERLGDAIFRRRKAEKLKLRQLAKRLRVSAAQLSRIERGQVANSRLFRDHPEDIVHGKRHRRIEITDCRLKAFVRE